MHACVGSLVRSIELLGNGIEGVRSPFKHDSRERNVLDVPKTSTPVQLVHARMVSEASHPIRDLCSLPCAVVRAGPHT